MGTGWQQNGKLDSGIASEKKATDTFLTYGPCIWFIESSGSATMWQYGVHQIMQRVLYDFYVDMLGNK